MNSTSFLLKNFLILFRPLYRISTSDNIASTPDSCTSFINSVTLPKQANPAFLVLAPDGSEARSIIVTLNPGCFFVRCRAVHNPVNPLPAITTSAGAKKASFSQYDTSMIFH
jgi:hypothetical protein